MSDAEPIFRQPVCASSSNPQTGGEGGKSTGLGAITFTRKELDEILQIYGRKVAQGEWRDYAIDMRKDRAVFSVFRRSSECPIYRIEKLPKLARRQGAYRVVAATGLIMRRGHSLARVLGALDKPVRLVEA